MGAVSSVVEAVSDTVSDIGSVVVNTVSNVVDTAVDVWHDVSEPVVDTQLGRLALNVATGGQAAPVLAAYDISRGADPTKALTNAAISYFGSEVISPEISAALGGDTAANIAADALVGGTKSAIQGGDFTSGALMGGVTSGLNAADLAAAEEYLSNLEGGFGPYDTSTMPTEQDVLASMPQVTIEPDIFQDTTAIDNYLYNLEPGAGYDTTTMPTEQAVLEIMGTPDVPYEYSGNPMDATPPPEDYVPPDYTNIPAETYFPSAPSEPTIPNLTNAQIASLLKTGLGLFGGITGGVKALQALSSTPTPSYQYTNLPPIPQVTPFTGTYSGMNPYQPEYFQQVQQNYNRLFPTAPADIATPLQSWYDTKFVPDTTISKKLFGV